jgi:hypothetical protein
MSQIIFEKKYDGETLYDLGRDIHECFDKSFNPKVENIPVDEYGFQQGNFVVSVKWIPNE